MQFDYLDSVVSKNFNASNKSNNDSIVAAEITIEDKLSPSRQSMLQR